VAHQCSLTARQAHQDPQDLPASPDSQEAQDSQEALDSQETRELLALKSRWLAHDAQEDSQDPLAHQDQPETQEAMASQDLPDRDLDQDQPDHPAHQDQPEAQDSQEATANQETQDRTALAALGAQARRDLQETQEAQDSQEDQDTQADQEAQDQLAQLELPVSQEAQEAMATPDSQARTECPARTLPTAPALTAPRCSSPPRSPRRHKQDSAQPESLLTLDEPRKAFGDLLSCSYAVLWIFVGIEFAQSTRTRRFGLQRPKTLEIL